MCHSWSCCNSPPFWQGWFPACHLSPHSPTLHIRMFCLAESLVLAQPSTKHETHPNTHWFQKVTWKEDTSHSGRLGELCHVTKDPMSQYKGRGMQLGKELDILFFWQQQAHLCICSSTRILNMDLPINTMHLLPHLQLTGKFPDLETRATRQEVAKLQWLSPEKTFWPPQKSVATQLAVLWAAPCHSSARHSVSGWQYLCLK